MSVLVAEYEFAVTKIRRYWSPGLRPTGTVMGSACRNAAPDRMINAALRRRELFEDFV
jgi:hypothetical protein